MMLPAPAARMRGMASCVACSSHVKLVRMMASQPRGVDSSNGWRNVPPTTLTRTSSRSPKRASTSVKNSVTASVSRASSAVVITSAPDGPKGRGGILQAGGVPVAQRHADAGHRQVHRTGPPEASAASHDDRQSALETSPLL